MKERKSRAEVRVENIYQLDGRVPVSKAIPFGLQHVLAMFVANVAPVTLVFLVSTAETIGDTSAVCTGGLGREITEKEVSGSLACNGFISAISGGVFGCPPITSFSQNVGLVAMTKVVNRFTILFSALTEQTLEYTDSSRPASD